MLSKYNPYYILAASFVLWIGLFITRMNMYIYEYIFVHIIEVFLFILHIFSIYCGASVYFKCNNQNRKIFGFLLISIITIFLIDISWYLIPLNLGYNVNKVIIAINMIGFLIWSISSSVFMIIVLKKYVLNLQKRFKRLLLFIIIDIVLISLFAYQLNFVKSHALDTHFIFTIWHVNLFIHVLEFSLRLIVTNLVLMCLIYSEDNGFTIFLIGIIVIISSYSFDTYAGILKKAPFYSYADMFWLWGIICQTWGGFFINKGNSYVIKKWVIKDSAIRGALLFLSFSIYTIIFGIVFWCLYLLGIINQQNFLALPIFFLVYTPVVIYAFISFSRYLERPFKQIIQNIENIMLNETVIKPKMFAIDEFIILQDFINKAFIYKTHINELRLKLENNKRETVEEEQKRFRKSIGQLVHDMSSPIEAINSFINLQKREILDSDRLNLRSSLKRLSALSSNLLSQYKSNMVVSHLVKILVMPHLAQIIEEKELEYKDKNITFKFDKLEDDMFASVLINIEMFHRMISNLINNAVDATAHLLAGSITLRFRVTADFVIIFVEDNGVGMPQMVQDLVLSGEQVTKGKLKGCGLGLTQVNDTIKSVNGKLDIYATLGEGTEIVIKLPRSSSPEWLADKITLKENDVLVILDDDLLIHQKWMKYFERFMLLEKNLIIKYFMKYREFESYVQTLSNEEQNAVFLLIDYDLNDTLNGLEIVEKLKIRRSVLVTGYANDVDVQNKVMSMAIKMLPKNCINKFKVTVAESIDTKGRSVDMVWLDDQDFFVKSIISESYSNLNIKIYTDPEVFIDEIINYDCDTRIVIDMYYENNEGVLQEKTGLEIAKYLNNHGYKQIIILTGAEIDFALPNGVKLILKNDKESIRSLDKIIF